MAQTNVQYDSGPMLAGPRKRQKISGNPNGTSLIDDDSSVGRKLLSQMGWKKGKGLGLKEQGDVDFIKVKENRESRGLGCSRADAEKWIAHQEDFNSVLASLSSSANTNEDMAPSPDAANSQSGEPAKSKPRILYAKFAKSRDLSSHSESDLTAILGKPRKRRDKKRKSISAPTSQGGSDNEDVEPPVVVDVGAEELKKEDPFLSETRLVTSSLSLHEYFTSKLAGRAVGRQPSSAANLSLTPSPDLPVSTDLMTDSVDKPQFFIGDTKSSEDECEGLGNTRRVTDPDTKSPLVAGVANDRVERKMKKKKKKKRHPDNEEADVDLERQRHSRGGKIKPAAVHSCLEESGVKFVSDEEEPDTVTQQLQSNSSGEPEKKKKKKKRKKRSSDED